MRCLVDLGIYERNQKLATHGANLSLRTEQGSLRTGRTWPSLRTERSDATNGANLAIATNGARTLELHMEVDGTPCWAFGTSSSSKGPFSASMSVPGSVSHDDGQYRPCPQIVIILANCYKIDMEHPLIRWIHGVFHADLNRLPGNHPLVGGENRTKPIGAGGLSYSKTQLKMSPGLDWSPCRSQLIPAGRDVAARRAQPRRGPRTFPNSWALGP